MSSANTEEERLRLGLPGEQVGPIHLTFEPTANVLIVACSVRTGSQAFPQLYLRHKEAGRYQSVSALVGELVGNSTDTLCIASWTLGSSRLYCSVIGLASTAKRITPARELGLNDRA